MARPKRLQFDGAQYLVTFRAAHNRTICADEEDFERLESILATAAEKHRVVVKAYCLLSSRVALVVETPHANLSVFQQTYMTGYASYHRGKHGMGGQLFADRFRSKVLANGPHLLAVSALIHLMPVQDSDELAPGQQVANAAEHRWSSLATFLSVSASDDGFVHPKSVLKAVGGRVTERPRRYRAFLTEGLRTGDHEQFREGPMSASAIAIGDSDFIKRINALHDSLTSRRKPKELRVHGTKRKGLSKKKIVKTVCDVAGKKKSEMLRQRKGSHNRALLSWALYEFGELSQDDIAHYLGFSAGATVSQHNKRIREAVKTDKALGQLVKRIRDALEDQRAGDSGS